MRVGDVLAVKGCQVYTVGPDETVADVVRVLMAHRIGAALVVDDDGLAVGIITERDVLRECLDRAHALGTVRVRTAMTGDLIVGSPEDDVECALALMTSQRIRHLPVIADEGVAGLVSIGDLVKASLDETAHENGVLREYIAGG